MKHWLALMRSGDWLTVALGTLLVMSAFALAWTGGRPERAVIRVEGKVVAEFPLDAPRRFSARGPLGETVIEIAPGRARVLSDPGPRQYCVQQGWLIRPNAIAICAPNHVSLSLSGREPNHDSLNY
ncbi:NusG domain II-containing protein [Sulfuricystis multivorans]|uniref:NusG domain II-containing protein n=1 Tax=Sulfuricystis multivorans TaxID=2211108 RepID=UPI0024DF3708|nr:NusG domain II-containing protein [Sulfuricystis multivorans]